MTSISFIPIDYDYFDFEERNYVKLIGRDDKGKRVCVIDSFEPYFWAVLKDGLSEKKIDEVKKKIDKIEVRKENGRITKVEKTEVHNKKYLGNDVKAIKIFITNYKDGHAVADQMDFEEIEKRREYDISFITRYIMDKKIVPLNWYVVEGNELGKNDFEGLSEKLEVDLCFKAEKIKKSDKQPEFEPRILGFDIETSEFEIGKGEVLMVSLCGKNFKKVLTWKKCNSKQDFVECFKDEKEMLKKFVEYVKEYNPDVLAGYFSDGFDLPYLRARAEANKIKLKLGLDGSQPSFARGRIPSGKINGIVHIDLFRFIETAYSQYLQSETLSLNEVASELLGEKKAEFDFANLSKMKENNWKDFFEYNLQDSCLTYKLAGKIWADMMEFSKIMQEPLFDVTRDGMSSNVENYILHNLESFNEIAEKRPLHDEIGKRRGLGKYEGAFVFQPLPGIYEDIVMFDFTSMYGSVIVSYNLSLSTKIEKKTKETQQASLKSATSLEVDLGEEGKAYFTKEQGFFPLMLNEIIDKRKKFKKEYNENPNALLKARSNAYKLLANASYGYQGFFGARYYCREAAAATAAMARKSILETIDKIKNKGYKIIYSDTDSIAFLRDGKSKKEINDFLEKINKELPGIMGLELEDFYNRGLFVMKRSGKEGAKKKYALINEKGKLKIRGFETVRRDWCDLARELQNKVLNYVLTDGNEKKALELVKETVKKIKERKIDKKELIIKTQLKKPINEYLSISPHVVAAQKMHDAGMPVRIGMVIEFFIAETREKKSLVRDKVKLPDEKGEYNVQYYLEHQIIPAVENILDVFGIKIQEVIDGNKQKKLF